MLALRALMGRDNADLLVEYLIELDIEYVFGVPGGAIEPLLDALARNRSKGGPQAIITRHEASAAFMAEGYTRETGKLGVCFATTGPGTTNLITGVASAYTEGVPMLVISAQTNLEKFGRNALQESSCTLVDTVAMLSHCTRYSSLVSHSHQVPNKLIAAIMASQRQPLGPVHLSFPSDVLRTPIDDDLTTCTKRLKQPISVVDKHAIEQLCQLVVKSKRFALLIGKDCEDGIDSIIEFAELTHALMITNPAGKRWMNGLHPLYCGVFGFAGHQSAKALLADPSFDFIVAVGVPITEFDSSGWDELLLNERLIHVDANPEHFSRSAMGKLFVCGNIKTIFQRLIVFVKAELKSGNYRCCPDKNHREIYHQQHPIEHSFQIELHDVANCSADTQPLKPQRVVTEFAAAIPNHFRLHIDAGNAWSWFTHYFHRSQTSGHYHIGMAFGSMGWAISAAVGSCLGSKQPSVCITGDGAYLMAGQEISVALQHKLPVIYVILNDSALGMVKHGQIMSGAERTGYRLPQIDFAKMVNSMEIQGITIRNSKQLCAIDWQALGNKNAPTLIDIMIDLDEVPPMQQRVMDLVGEVQE